MTTIEHLKAARALIEKGWTQHFSARRNDGQFALPTSPEAVCWCVIGAIARSVASSSARRIEPFTELLESAAGVVDIGNWNDDPNRTQSDVLALFDKAIELEESKGGHNE